jgi:hypothetical protein
LPEDFPNISRSFWRNKRWTFLRLTTPTNWWSAWHAAEFVVFGVVTEYCVGLAVEGLLKRKRRVAVVRDAIETLASEAGDKTLAELQSQGATLVTTTKSSQRLAVAPPGIWSAGEALVLLTRPKRQKDFPAAAAGRLYSAGGHRRATSTSNSFTTKHAGNRGRHQGWPWFRPAWRECPAAPVRRAY